jgi:hypothetical protein
MLPGEKEAYIKQCKQYHDDNADEVSPTDCEECDVKCEYSSKDIATEEEEAIEELADQARNRPILVMRDGNAVYLGTEMECWMWMHNEHSFSLDWACKYEGYSLVDMTSVLASTPIGKFLGHKESR